MVVNGKSGVAVCKCHKCIVGHLVRNAGTRTDFDHKPIKSAAPHL